MGALSFLLKRTIINYFKRFKEKKSKAIGPIFVILWFTIFLFSGKRNTKGSSDPKIFVTLFVAFVFCFILYCLYSGTKKLSSKFSMCDVNLVFTAPIKPQTVMIYGIIKKIAVELLGSIYLVYQIPYFLKKFNVPVGNVVLLIIMFLLFQFVFCNILKLFTFSLNTKYKNLGVIIRDTIKAFMVLVVLGIVFIIYKGEFLKDMEAITSFVTYNSNFKYIPVLGWMREITIQVITGVKISFFLYGLMLLLTSILLLYITYNMELDFYEEMVSSAEENNIARRIENGNVRVKDGKKNIFLSPFKNTQLNLKGAYGAKAIFYKNMNEYYKRSLVFNINLYSVILLVISIFLGLKVKGFNIIYLLLIPSLNLFFSEGFGGKIYTEINYSYIFLIPDTAGKKLFYGVLSSVFKICIDAFLLFIPFAIGSRTSPLKTIICILCYISLGVMLSYSGLFAFRIANLLGFTGAISQAIFFMLFQMLLIVPYVIALAMTSGTFRQTPGYSFYTFFLLISAVLSLLFSKGAVGLLNNMEFSDKF